MNYIQSTRSQRFRHDGRDLACTHAQYPIDSLGEEHEATEAATAEDLRWGRMIERGSSLSLSFPSWRSPLSGPDQLKHAGLHHLYS